MTPKYKPSSNKTAYFHQSFQCAVLFTPRSILSVALQIHCPFGCCCFKMHVFGAIIIILDM